MKKTINSFIFLCIFLLFSCNKNLENNKMTQTNTSSRIEQLQDIQFRPTNKDSLIRAWKWLIQDQNIDQSNLYAAKANYQLARLYGRNHQNDSAALYLETAFERIEAEPGHLDEKTRIYQGMGNVNLAQGSLHRANYYYNKAAAILLADSTVALEVPAKVAVLLAAAQSNQQFHRYELALKMNQYALSLSQQLPAGHLNRQRSLTQLIQTLYHTHADVNSIGQYIHRLDTLQLSYPENYDAFFLYESKTLYYDRLGKTDSVLKYELSKAQLQEERRITQQPDPTSLNNLFISYVNIAGHYTQLGQLTPAWDYFERARTLIAQEQTTIQPYHLLVYHKNLETYYVRLGSSLQALKEANRVSQLQETLNDRQNTQAIAEMNSLYEIQAQERAITQLNESIRMQQLELQRNRLWLFVSVLSVVIAVMVLFFIYYSFRQRRIRQDKDRVILQQQLLRTQIEPHFIFNTLTALQSYIRRGDSKEAINYLGRFSKLLRSSLELSREEHVSLEDEIVTLEHYLSLQQMRFDNAFTYHISLAEGLDTEIIHIPPMLIQPFVENAILHGVDMKSGKACVNVNFSEEEQSLKIEITDSGRTLKINKNSEGHRSLSGVISRERLALLGKNARMETRKNGDGGTSVTVYVPLSR